MELKSLSPVLVGITAGLLLVCSLLLVPHASWAPPLIKIGVVNWEQVVSRYDKFQKKISSIQSRRQRLLRFIEKKNEGSTVPENQAGQQEQVYEEALEQVSTQKERFIRDAHKEIREVIKQVAIKRGYSLILSESEVLYASEVYVDLTDPVIQKLNEQQPQETLEE